MSRRWIHLGLLLVTVILSGCPAASKTASLDETLQRYEQMIRWSEWNAAMEFLAPEYLNEHPITRLDIDRLNLFRVTSYTVGQSAVTTDGLALRQSVEIRLFSKNQAVERVIYDQQFWQYDAETDRWLLHSGLPDVTRRY
jgi:hypothetical protein